MVSTSESQHKMEGWLFLNVVIRKSSSVLKLLSSEDKSLLVGGDSLSVLDFSFDALNCVCAVYPYGHCLASECSDEYLHSSPESEYKVEGWFFADVVVCDASSVFKTFASKDKSLLVCWDSFLLLDSLFDCGNWISWFDFNSNGFSC